MKLTNVIREASTDHVIYFLLSSYINSVRYDEKWNYLPGQIAEFPLSSKDEVRSRFETLMCALDVASRRLDDNACLVIKEALIVFGTALSRLQSLEAGRSLPWIVQNEHHKVNQQSFGVPSVN